jgi:D-alanine-D-alanine ligase
MKKNIGIFFGGQSAEHEISIISAVQAIKAIDKNAFNVVPIYIDKDGIWYTGSWLLYIDNYRNYKELVSNCTRVMISLHAKDRKLYKYPQGIFKRAGVIAEIDIAFPVFHGTNGEDGSFQGVFEIMNIPYISSNVLSSSVCMDKTIFKDICKQNDIPVVNSISFKAADYYQKQDETCRTIIDAIGLPCVVKPNNLGSSIGVTKVSNDVELKAAIEVACSYSNKVIVDECILNLKELNCSVAKINGESICSEIEEPIINYDAVLSFSEKYLASEKNEGMASLKRKLPAEISVQLKTQVESLSKKIYEYLGCSGVVRIDFLLDENKQSLYLNEVNTIPGSLAFYLWEPKGKKFEGLINDLANTAIKEFAEKSNVKKVYVSNVLTHLDGSKLSGKLGLKF